MPQPNLTVTLAQINPMMGDVAGNILKIREAYYEADERGVDVVVFPELCLTGSPLEGLADNIDLTEAVEAGLEAVCNATKGRRAALIVGAPLRDGNKFFSAAPVFSDGQILGSFRRRGLPGDDALGEVRHTARIPVRARITRILDSFHKTARTPGADSPDDATATMPVTVHGVKIGVLIGGDVWRPETAARFKAAGAELLISINASAFRRRILETRLRDVAALRVSETGLPLIYVNAVGGQDETVFDGGSFAFDDMGRRILLMPQWEECSMDCDLTRPFESSAEVVLPNSDEEIYRTLMLAIGDYVRKSGFTDVVLGLSGGMDSALVAAIAGDALGAEHVHCVRLPSQYTSDLSNNAAAEMCEKWGFSMETAPIGAVVDAADKTLAPGRPDGLQKLTRENMQARARGYLLMTISNDNNWLLLANGNKSESAMGYATLYGDMCGGYAPLKDVFKTTVYSLARWRNANRPAGLRGPDGEAIPVAIIDRPPSAELAPGQLDTDSLPPYPVLDAILTELLERGAAISQMAEKGFDPELVDKICRMYTRSEYKRRQGAPGPKITDHFLARDTRIPVVNGFAPHMRERIQRIDGEN